LSTSGLNWKLLVGNWDLMLTPYFSLS